MRKAKWLTIARHALRCAVVSSLAGLCVPAFATLVPGGTITFRGALVAPPFDIVSGSASMLGTSGFQNDSADVKGVRSSAVVTYYAPPHNAPSAEVSLVVVGDRAAAVSSHFIDGAGQRVGPSLGRSYHVGPAGGALLIRRSENARAESTTLVTVVTEYN
ncbi:hypothetical protein [Caballeronia sp. ATUFL_F1_KS4A]|uniref:hypothetical protein n=1 Tax=Caballeronia sp. ATUFL_F1_KS4A TaxID=2921768 RepID=UPI00202778AC|nr:hypothetical protein [Caballeronia sp. ATUFL_F1_KS4A]